MDNRAKDMDDRDIDEFSASREQARQVHDDRTSMTKAPCGVAVSLTIGFP